MRKPYQDPRIGNRRWIAWKLVQLAQRIYDAEYYERITVTNPDGRLVYEAVINADLYHGGVSSTFGGRGVEAGAVVDHDQDFRPAWLGD